MIRLRASLVFAALLSPIVAAGQSEPAMWRFVHPNAQALISIDWARIRQSPAGAMIRETWLTSGALPAVPGLELLNDIDRVLVSSPGNISPDESTQQPVLIAIHGHFDPAEVRQIFIRFGAKPQSYNSFQVYRPQRKDQRKDKKDAQRNDAKDMAFLLFDPDTILFGDSKSIFLTLDRNQFGPPPQAAGSLLARAAAMDPNYDLWVIMDAFEIMSSDSVAALLRGGEWASEAQSFEAGVNLRAGLAADITVRFSSDDVAKRVTTELTRVMNMAARDHRSGAQMQEIARKLKFGSDGSAAKISLRLTEQELEKSAQAFAAGLKAAQSAGDAASTSDAAPAPATVPSVAKSAVIRIEGLDEGPREIPYPDAQH
jgi:hypothetical protein